MELSKNSLDIEEGVCDFGVFNLPPRLPYFPPPASHSLNSLSHILSFSTPNSQLSFSHSLISFSHSHLSSSYSYPLILILLPLILLFSHPPILSSHLSLSHLSPHPHASHASFSYSPNSQLSPCKRER